MELLSEMPFHDLGFLYHSLVAAVGSVLALSVVVAAAAFGLRRIQAVVRPASKFEVLADDAAEPSKAPALPVIDISPTTPACEACLGTPRARFTSYYSYEACPAEDGCGEEEAEEEDCDEEAFCGEVDEEIFVKRRWEIGLNRCEEMKDFSGGVVRLWAGAGSPRVFRREFQSKMGNYSLLY